MAKLPFEVALQYSECHYHQEMKKTCGGLKCAAVSTPFSTFLSHPLTRDIVRIGRGWPLLSHLGCFGKRACTSPVTSIRTHLIHEETLSHQFCVVCNIWYLGHCNGLQPFLTCKHYWPVAFPLNQLKPFHHTCTAVDHADSCSAAMSTGLHVQGQWYQIEFHVFSATHNAAPNGCGGRVISIGPLPVTFTVARFNLQHIHSL